MFKKMSLLLVLLAAIVLNGCFKSNESGDMEKGVVLKRNNNTVSVLAKDEVWGGTFVIDREIRTDEVITEADKMKIVKREDGKTVINIVDFDGGIKEGEKIFEIKECLGTVKVELTDSIKEDEFENEVKKELKRAVKRGARAGTADELLGDFNSDSKVDVQDFVLFQSGYGGNSSVYDIAPAVKGTAAPYIDVYSKRTTDGMVDLLDFLIFAKNYGKNIVNLPTVTSIVLNGLAVVEENSTISIYATVKYSDNTQKSEVVNWSSSDETVAQVTANGEWVSVKGVKAGTSEIKAEKDGKVGILPLTVTSKGTVALDSIVVDGEKSVAPGSSINLTSKGIFADGSENVITAVWTSSNTAVATVDATGKVTGVAGGTVKIYAEKNGIKTEKSILVKAAIDGIVIHCKSAYVPYIWAWTTAGGATPNYTSSKAWPGDAMTLEAGTTDWYKYTISSAVLGTATDSNIIFSNKGASQTTAVIKSKGEWWYNGTAWSDVDPNTDIDSPVVTATPAAGKVEATTLNVTLTATDNKDSAAKIYYTVDGSCPTLLSTQYSSAVTLTKNGTVKAIAADAAGNISRVYVFSYELGCDATAPVITATPAPGRYDTAQTVKISAADNKDSSPVIYYTVDGTEPKAELIYMYNGQAINVDKNMTIKVLAIDNSGNKRLASFSYYIGGSTVKYNDFREETIYFMMTDRFADGDTTNNNIWGDEYLPNGAADMYKYDESKTGVLSYYHGGDFAGILKNLDYLQDMGFTAIWITPAAKQPEGRYYWSGTGDPYQASAFHGYWAYDFDQIDPHLHSQGKASNGWDDFQKLADALHARGMKLMLDVVINHGHPGDSAAPTKWESKELEIIMDGKTWKYDSAADPYGSNTVSTTPYVRNGFFNYGGDYKLSSLLDFNERGEAGKDAREHLKNVFKKYIDHGVDAMRVDTAAYVTNEWMGEFADEMANYAKTKGNDYFYLMSEGWCGRYDAIQRAAKDKTGALHMIDMQASCLDFPGQMVNVFKAGGDYASFKTFTANDEAQGIGDATYVGMFVDNHDCFRANGVFSETEYKNALNYIYFFRGIPIVYYGTEAMYSWSGAYASTNKEDVVSRWMLGQQGIDYVKTNKPNMYKHLKMLNTIRKKCEGVQKGKQVELLLSGDKAVLKREFGDKSAYVAISKGAAYSYTFDSLPAGTYLKITTDSATGNYSEESVTVSGSATVSVNANSVVILQKQ